MFISSGVPTIINLTFDPLSPGSPGGPCRADTNASRSENGGCDKKKKDRRTDVSVSPEAPKVPQSPSSQNLPNPKVDTKTHFISISRLSARTRLAENSPIPPSPWQRPFRREPGAREGREVLSDRAGLRDPVDPENPEDLDLPVRYRVLNRGVGPNQARI